MRVGVLGAAGTVGQRFIQMLEKHPWFEVVALAGSERQVGREYGEVVRWQLGEDPPEYARRMILQQSEPTLECEVVFSALPSDKAAHLESRFAEAGYKVFTNAGGHRMDSDVPLMVPYINPEHLGAIPCQQQNRGWKGFILTNPNCASIPLAMALKPLHERIGVVRVLVTTMQGVSGAGYPGVPSLDILGNIVPHIEGEERKVETEPLKMLGAWGGYTFEYAPIRISAQCHRAPVRDGHLVAASVEFSQPVAERDVLDAWLEWRPDILGMDLPSSAAHPLVYRTEPDRPQPAKDLMAEGGMGTVLGRLRPCPLLGWKFNALSHNTVLGAAGCSLLNAELYFAATEGTV